MFPGVWRHGDWIEITSRGTAIIYGRSDSTINRGGVRMGTSEIYRAVLSLPEVVDALVIDVPKPGTEGWMPLFVVLSDGVDAERRPRRADQAAPPRGLLAAPRARRGPPDPRGPPHAVRQGARSPRQAHPDRDARRASGQPRIARQPGGVGLLRGARAGRVSAGARAAPARAAAGRAPARAAAESPHPRGAKTEVWEISTNSAYLSPTPPCVRRSIGRSPVSPKASGVTSPDGRCLSWA